MKCCKHENNRRRLVATPRLQQMWIAEVIGPDGAVEHRTFLKVRE